MRAAETLFRTLCLGMAAALSAQAAAAPCSRPVYLTFDTGHMGVAPLIAQVLERQQVKATFFLANEPTRAPDGAPDGGTSLGATWAPWWKTLAAQGHDFGSHTWDHLVWQKDLPDGFVFKPTAGNRVLPLRTLSRADYCAQLQRTAERFHAMTGQSMRLLFRAPSGKTSAQLLQTAATCGWQHVPWTPAGFLGDELPSDRHPNQALLRQALSHVRSGDILLAHLGIWSRQDPWAPAVLEPLIVGLKAQGLCFATLRDHPVYGRVAAAPTAVKSSP